MSDVAIITPYYKEDIETLWRCHQSVLDQEIACRHVMVADGHARPELDEWAIDHIKLPISHADIGSTARLIGAIHAIGLSQDAIAFLDADNWYQKSHIKSLCNLREKTRAAFLSSSRMLYSLDGQAMGKCPITTPDGFIDTNCMMFWKESFHLLHHWVLMPRYGHLIGDRIMMHHIRKSGVSLAFSEEATVCYSCNKLGMYELMKVKPPAGVCARPDYEQAFERWIADGHPPLD